MTEESDVSGIASFESAAFKIGAIDNEQLIQASIAISLKRIADAFDCANTGGRPQGTVLWGLETIASAANAGRSRCA